MAALTRAEKLPRLDTLLRDMSKERAAQTPGEVRQAVIAWAGAAGLKLHRRAEMNHG